MKGERPQGALLRERTLTSVFWILALNVARAGLLFLVPWVVAWLGGPTEMGLAQLAWGVYAVALPVVSLGTKAAVLQRPELSQSYLSSVFVVNLAMGALTAAVLAVGAPWIADLGDGDPRLVLVLRWMGAVCFVFSLTVVQSALLARRLEFRFLSLANIAGSVGGAAAAAVAFVLGARLGVVGAAVAGYLAVSTTLLWIAGRWRPTLTFVPAEAMSAVRFGVTASLASFAFNFSMQLERFLFSALFGQAALGLYGAARNVNRDTLRNLMKISDEVLLPGLSALQADLAKARDYYLRAMRYEFLAFAPAALFIAVFAREIVLLVYGPEWLEVVPLVRLLTPLVLFTITRHTVGAVFLSQGRPDIQLRWSVLMVALVAAYTLAGAPWGLSGAVTAVSTLEVVGWVISHRWANRLLELPFRRFLANLRAPALAAGLFGGSLWLLRDVTGSLAAEPSWPTLAAWGVGAVPLWAAALHVMDRELSRAFWRTLGAVLGAGLARR